MSQQKERDLYDIVWARKVLGLGARATMKEIRTAYRNASKKWHPDHRRNASEKNTGPKMQDINRAYKIIMDFVERYEYVLDPKRESEFDPEKWWWDKFGTFFARKVKKNKEG